MKKSFICSNVCPLRSGGGGLKALADISAKIVCVFFLTAPLRVREAAEPVVQYMYSENGI